MREIEFRAKALYGHGQWAYGYLSRKNNDWFISDNEGTVTLVDIDTMGQSSSDKDNRDKKIYEGDICRIWIGGYKQDSPYVVEDIRELYLELNRDDNYYRIGTIEVVGNVHENPELLGGDGL